MWGVSGSWMTEFWDCGSRGGVGGRGVRSTKGFGVQSKGIK